MPPNAWLWSLIESCQCQDDINLLFEVFQKLRRFVTTLKNNAPLLNIKWLRFGVSGLQRLSNLRIHVRVGAIDSGTPSVKYFFYGYFFLRRWLMQLFVVVGKKALWKHNVLGLTPSVASAQHLLVCLYSLRFLKCVILAFFNCYTKRVIL